VPRAFVETLAEDARRHGLVAIVAPAHMPDGVEDALDASLRLDA
jgi:hypothetical protein